MALITCKDVTLGYEGKPVVEGLDFAVNQGDYLCVVGENGSGKSTLIKGLLRLLQPLRGSIEYGGGLRPSEIGYLPQQTAAQKDFPASVYEVVLSGRLASLGLKPFYSRRDKQLALDNLAHLGVLELKNACYRELSGGQQQRVLLARALCATQKLLLLDEPVAGLDPMATAQLYSLIQRVNRETGITIIMVSHDIHAAVQNASHILHLQHRQEFFGGLNAYQASELGKRFLSRKGEQNV